MKKYLFTALSMAVIATSSLANAQNQNLGNSAPQQAGSAQMPTSDLTPDQITDKQLVQFAEVQQNLIQINDHYKVKMDQSSDKEKVAERFYKEMANAVENSPLEVSEYNSIAQNLNQSEKLQQRFTQIAQKMMQQQPAVSAQ